ncbi:Agrin [Penaeus vannamei]|uniref:Agrin n=1 Tax=Penaeus vannamei TaxID=6689 RepID=A0A423SVE2_PENVA|nr:Agrin [Penaeus vannamei]
MFSKDTCYLHLLPRPSRMQALGGEVCGNDGKTYSSECHLRMTACSTQVQLRARHKGNCDLCLDVHCKYGARCEGGRCICPTDCPDKREPVCGSDRITYNNECVMRKVACEKNEDISYLFFGECDEIGGIVTDVIYPTPLPPTSPEDPCHAYKCIAGAQCKADASDGRPRCICDFYCSPPPRYEPVCGSDMEFYESECLMRLHACNIQVELFVLPVEKCAAAQKTRACNGTSPLINPSTGEDLYCGEGGTICPPGTYCHRDQELAKCCRDFSVRIADTIHPLPPSFEHVSPPFFSNSLFHLTPSVPHSLELISPSLFNSHLSPSLPHSLELISPSHFNSHLTPSLPHSLDRVSLPSFSNSHLTPSVPHSLELISPSHFNSHLTPSLPHSLDRVSPPFFSTTVIEAPVPDDCDQSQWGCCEDGINFAKGPDREGCPEACRCHRLGEKWHCFFCYKASICSERCGKSCDCDNEHVRVTAGESLNSGQGYQLRHPLPAGFYGCRGGPKWWLLAVRSKILKFNRRAYTRPLPPPYYQSSLKLLRQANYTHFFSPFPPFPLPLFSLACGCSLFGSLRTDCKQMTGECVCKPGVSGHRCTQCPRGKVLRPEGCVYDDALVPEATTCELLQCHFGGQCREEGGMATCRCTHHCLPGNMGIGLVVCGSDRVTYASECELKYQACVQQADIVVIAFGPCDGE